MPFYQHKCLRCDREWDSKLERPTQCPRCKQTNWDTPARVVTVKASAPNEKQPRIKTCLRCNYSWATRIEKPKICPRCKTMYWEDGISPADARKKLRSMIVAVAGTTYDFCEAVDIPYEKLKDYFNRKPMNLAQLEAIKKVLIEKGYKIYQ